MGFIKTILGGFGSFLGFIFKPVLKFYDVVMKSKKDHYEFKKFLSNHNKQKNRRDEYNDELL
jgi:hypothetical protein